MRCEANDATGTLVTSLGPEGYIRGLRNPKRADISKGVRTSPKCFMMRKSTEVIKDSKSKDVKAVRG